MSTRRIKGLKPGMKALPPIRKRAPWSEHPDDRRDRVAAEKAARVLIEEYAAARRVELIALIATYADGEARDLFERLREEFWGGDVVGDAMRKIERDFK